MRRIKENGGKTMRKRQNEKLSMLFWLMAVAALGMIMFLTHEPVHAADACASYSRTTDSDGDGFSDYDECNGITFAGSGGGTFPGYKSRTSDRSKYLDPNSKDLFVIMAPASGGYFNSLGTNRLEYIYNSTNNGGLGISTHEIDTTKAAADRTVCKTATNYPCTKPTGQTYLERAVKVTESLDDGGTGVNRNILASSSSMHGTPNGTDLCMIYTVRIKNSLQGKCGCTNILDASCANCCDNTGVCGTNLFYKYIKHTIAHEIGHQIMLTKTNDPTWGWHYPEGTGVDLDYQVIFDGTSFLLGTVFTGDDSKGATLK
jgi:hypothetical protein